MKGVFSCSVTIFLNVVHVRDLLQVYLNICKKVSEYDQEIPQSHTSDQPTAP